MQAQVQKLTLSSQALRALSPQQRYVFALTGQIFNELILLMKWVDISRKAPGDPGPQEDASVGVTMFVLGILIGKTHGALEILRRESVSEIFKADYLRLVNGLEVRWDEVLARHDNMPWLARVRNMSAFHYPTVGQWGPALNENAIAEGAYIYVGKRYADTYYHWSAMAAALPSMTLVNAEDPFQGLGTMVAQLGALLGDITDCLARGLQEFMRANGVGDVISQAIRFEAPELKPTALHYFFADERLKPE